MISRALTEEIVAKFLLLRLEIVLEVCIIVLFFVGFLINYIR